ncbi:MAG: radical SAM protein [Planctomycetota bacterium]|jgi:biotin synthase-like enzyme
MDPTDLNTGFEQGPIRPPSEAGSLLIRITRNCPWNRCAFCHTYRGERYSRRRAAEVIEDVSRARAAADVLKALSLRMGEGGTIGERTVEALRCDPAMGQAHWSVANFLLNGGRTAFLQDADPLAGPLEETGEIIRAMREAFPSIERITAYCRSRTAARIGPKGFSALRETGLDRIHIGLESGSDEVLALVDKGVDATTHIRGGRAVKEGGLELSEYVMPGLGGRKFTRTHALSTASVLNEIEPDFVRFRTLAVVESADLAEAVEKGNLEVLGDVDIVKEIRNLVRSIEVPTRLESDHILNLLQDVRGDLPEERDTVLGVIDDFLALPDDEQAHFMVGRRACIYGGLEDRLGPMRGRVEKIMIALKIDSTASADEAIHEMIKRFV